MGGFLAALGSGVAGAGGAAAQYGQQIRGLLESRRQDFASLMMHAADQAVDPSERAQYLSTASDLLSNKPMEKILPPFVKKVQEVHAGNGALAQAMGGPPAQPQPQPGPQAGATPGTGGSVGHPTNHMDTSPLPQPSGGAPAAPPAAQPSTNPLQGGPINVPPQASVAGIPSPGGAPAGIPSPMDVLGQFTQRPEYQTPAGRAMLAPAMTAELQHNEALRQEETLRQMDLGERQNALRELESSPEWSGLPDIMKSQYRLWAHSRSAPVPSMSAGLMRPVNVGQDQPSAAVPDAELVGLNGQSIDKNAVPFVRQQLNLLTGQNYYVPSTGPMARATDENGHVISVANVPGANLGTAPGLVTSQLRPREETDAAGGKFMTNATGGVHIPIPGAITPSFVPQVHTSVSQTPGQLPTTTRSVTTKGGISAPAPSVGAPPSDSTGSSVVKRKYDDWAAGGIAPAGKDMTAVQAYMEKNKLPTPTQLSAAGQANLQSVDAVFREIDDAEKALNAIKGNPMLGVDYARYKHLGQSTPYDSLFTKLSFEGLRSTAAAMKGNNSRAYPVIEKAFQHVPNLDRLGGLNPDSVDLMKDKLKAMREVLNDTRQTVLDDERKSGTVATGGAGIPTPGAAIMTGKQKSTGNPVYSTDGGKTWLPGSPPQ